MINTKKQLKQILIKLGYASEQINIEYPTNAEHGGYSCNLAMVLAKEQKKSPMDLAEGIIKKLEQDTYIKDTFEKIDVVKPGFINFHLKEEYLQDQVAYINKEGESYGKSDIGKGKKVQVEFISANPTGPLTLANGRGGFTGDVLANILDLAGYEVQREYYINDIGNQIDILGHSVLKDDQAEYKGNYIDELNKEIKETDAKQAGLKAAQLILEQHIKPAVEKAGIAYDNYFSERAMHESGKAEEMLSELTMRGLVQEKDGAKWLKTSSESDSQDDKDRVLVKSDGSKTYFLSDIAYHWDKFHERKFNKVINIWGADHHGYVARMKAAVSMLGYKDQLEIILMQLVRLIRGGKEVKMSKRKGVYELLEELIDEVGLDAVRWFFLMRAPNTHMDFDMDLAKDKSKNNPVYYVQYAYTRLHSIMEKSQDVEVCQDVEDVSFNKSEKQLIKHLIRWPEFVEDISQSYQVNNLTTYAYELADRVQKFYEASKVIDNGKLIKSRFTITSAAQQVLKNSLQVLGISTPSKM